MSKDDDGDLGPGLFVLTWFGLLAYFLGSLIPSGVPTGEYAFDIENLECKQFILKYPDMQIDGNYPNVDEWIPVSCLSDFKAFYNENHLSKREAWNVFKFKVINN